MEALLSIFVESVFVKNMALAYFLLADMLRSQEF